MDKSTTEDLKRHEFEQTVLFNKNAKAVMQAINDQNSKIAGIQHEFNNIVAQLTVLHGEILKLKEEKVGELIAKLGHGPTVLED